MANESLENSDFKIYPNPVKDILKIDLLNEVNYKIEISNQLGQVVFSSTKYYNSVDISSLSKGIYFVKLSGNNKTFFEKIIKE